MKKLFLALAAVTLAAPAAAVAQDGRDRRVVFDNQSGVTVFQIHASNTGRTSWEEDMLGSDVLMSGNSRTANLEDGSGYCSFDVKIVFRGGRSLTQRSINVCEVSRILIHRDHLHVN